MPRRASLSLLVFSLLAILPLTGCGDSSTSGPSLGAPATIEKVAGDVQEAGVGAPVDVLPSVRVLDSGGDPVANATVIFSVASGAGTITGAQQTTNQAGIATVGSWTLGPTLGANTLQATVGLLPAVTFGATGANPCTHPIKHAFGTSVTQMLSESDCDLGDGYLLDSYRFTIPQGTASVRINQTSDDWDTLDPFLFVYDAQGRLIAFSDDSVFNENFNASIRLLAPPGDYFVDVTSAIEDQTGDYTFSTRAEALAVEGCDEDLVFRNVFLTIGVSTSQEVKATDCSITFQGAGGTFFSDRYLLFVPNGRTVAIRMSSTTTDPYLLLLDLTHQVIPIPTLDQDDNGGGGTTALITYTATENKLLLIDAGTALPDKTGTYTLSVQTPTASLATTPGADVAHSDRTLARSTAPAKGLRPARARSGMAFPTTRR